MAKITRALQKIFGQDATVNQRGKIGSLSAGSPEYTTDVEEMQSLTQYLNGLYDVVDGDFSPSMQDINALYYLITYQIAYLMQQGIAEWNSETPYFDGSLVNYGGKIYVSKDVISNVGNEPDDFNFWFPFSSKKSIDSQFVSYNMATRFFDTRTSAEDNSWAGVEWCKGLGIFIAVAGDGTNRLMRSKDGISWTGYTGSISGDQLRGIVWTDDQFGLAIIVGDTAGGAAKIYSSSNGTSWTSRYTGPATSSLDKVTYSMSLGLFVATGYKNSIELYILKSPDGITWTEASSYSDMDSKSVIWSEELGIFVIVGHSTVMTSEDGDIWTNRTASLTGEIISGVAWSAWVGLLVAVSYTGDATSIMTSPDGINWTNRQSPENDEWSDVVWCDGISAFIACGTRGSGENFMTSVDGINWIYRSDTTGNLWKRIVWSNELSLAVSVSSTGTGDRVATSR